MSKKVKLSKIHIKVGKADFELTLEQAKELQELLNDTFGKTVIMPLSPIIIERPVFTRPHRYWDATWTYTSDGTTAVGSDTYKGVQSGTVTYSLATA